jgi:hypothetical protein
MSDHIFSRDLNNSFFEKDWFLPLSLFILRLLYLAQFQLFFAQHAWGRRRPGYANRY